MGTSPDYQNIHSAFPASGRFFNEMELAGRAKVAVLGKTVVDELFANEDPIGKSIRLNRIGFKVIGVLPEKGVSGFRNMDDQIIVPVTTAMYRLAGTDYINYFEVQVHDQNSMPAVQENIVATLLKVRRLSDSQTEQFDVHNMAEIQKAAGEMIQTLAFLLGGIAAVSLLVGGIGIMNIMLVMVMERTHEIGLRKALGAENLDIMVQFLVESVLICFLGGVLGIIFGALASLILSLLAGWNTIISFSSVMLAFFFSLVVGLVFGLWPARRASKLLPAEALRYE
jgi:macrolide transport system ATP-binding/permease protein